MARGDAYCNTETTTGSTSYQTIRPLDGVEICITSLQRNNGGNVVFADPSIGGSQVGYWTWPDEGGSSTSLNGIKIFITYSNWVVLRQTGSGSGYMTRITGIYTKA